MVLGMSRGEEQKVQSSLKICQERRNSGTGGGGGHQGSRGGGSGQLLSIPGLEHHRGTFCQVEILSYPQERFLLQKRSVLAGGGETCPHSCARRPNTVDRGRGAQGSSAD